MSLVVELANLCPDELVRQLAPYFDEIRGACLSNDPPLRLRAAQSFGILASHPVNTEQKLGLSLSQFFEQLAKRSSAIGAEANRVQGSMVALSHFAARRRLQSPQDGTDLETIQRFLPILLDILKSSLDSTMMEAACRSLSQLCMFKAISLEDLGGQAGVSEIFEKVFKIAKEGNEVAILALGHMSIIIDESEHEQIIQDLLKKIFELHEIRQPETQLTVGETLCNLGAGWKSEAMLPHLTVDGPRPDSSEGSQILEQVVTDTLEKSKNTKPALKKASAMWLLCLLQFCGDASIVQQQLPAFQAAFKRCLSDRDELIQESASRGLGLVYEKGSRDLKDALVRDLVSSFSSNKADISGSVTEDTQLFEPGQLPTGEGSVTTYKDIMSLASEVGDPSLVYRFMSLASNNAIWSNRAAFGRFGLSSVLSDSSVDGYLAENPKMYSALYRYRFDPNANVRRSMNDIWNALVKDPTATVDKYFELIITDLLKNMTGREWRTRQASCAALADLLQGRKLEKVSIFLISFKFR